MQVDIKNLLLKLGFVQSSVPAYKFWDQKWHLTESGKNFVLQYASSKQHCAVLDFCDVPQFLNNLSSIAELSSQDFLLKFPVPIDNLGWFRKAWAGFIENHQVFAQNNYIDQFNQELLQLGGRKIIRSLFRDYMLEFYTLYWYVSVFALLISGIASNYFDVSAVMSMPVILGVIIPLSILLSSIFPLKALEADFWHFIINWSVLAMPCGIYNSVLCLASLLGWSFITPALAIGVGVLAFLLVDSQRALLCTKEYMVGELGDNLYGFLNKFFKQPSFKPEFSN